jgi:hypothetical protein
MFCPKCGIENDDEPRFCRGCGENLKVVSQAMSIRLPEFLASKMDAYIERKYRSLRREWIGSLVIAGLFIFLGFYQVIALGASWATEWFYLAFGAFMLLVGLWDSILYKRSLSTDVRIIKMGGASSTNELPPLDATQIVETPASITESTGHLDAVPRRQQKDPHE